MSTCFFLLFIFFSFLARLSRLSLHLNVKDIFCCSVLCLKPDSHRILGPSDRETTMKFEAISLIPRHILLRACWCLITYRTKFCSSSIIFVSHILRGDFPRVWSSILFCENSCCQSELIKHRLRSSRCNNVYLFLLPRGFLMRLDIKFIEESVSTVKTQNTKDCKESFLLTLNFYPTLSVHFMYFVCSAENPLQVKSVVCMAMLSRVFPSRCESLYCISYLTHNGLRKRVLSLQMN